ncbi:L-seryl-tRNA(Sec) selenium transferase [Marispirochaeta aestuarii]|uniref:L-seryl-tRNA(Sec) selenium transferase n=1 Tax=Marispirochaeta aestuarii TaxID=1963862 RepID=UPI0029C72152|nr:L-seryl-tRNA(Sec) selenium transferase [Marispirochaeta aestuarii]
MKKNQLAALPQIETLLQDPGVEKYIENLGRPVVAELARSVVDGIRRSVLKGDSEVSPFSEVLERLLAECGVIGKEKLQKVINATGIIIHTNMGRAPILREVWREAEEINCSYSNLEFDLKTGKRGKRKGLIPLLVSRLVGSEDALIVNNNAAAVFLILQTFARDREVIVNRGEQVQIGGGFRIPEILQQSGARLVEIGTTNISTREDYLSAFSDETAMILSVHRSNFAIRGFTDSPTVRELARIRPDTVLLCVDQGSGVIDEALPGEISVRTHLHDGADLVCFSGDKVLGGPQAGIIVGKRELIEKLESHPLMRVFRPGKAVYSLLEAGLVRRLNGGTSMVAETLALSMRELKSRGRKILQGIDRSKASVVESTLTSGGGSAPDESFPSLSVQIHIDRKADTILRALRNADPPIIGIISQDRVQLNLATLQPEDIPRIRAELQTLLGG